MERKVTITYRWWAISDISEEVKPEHIPILEEHANDRINIMRSEGYTSGELVMDTDNDLYRGHFEINTECL